jgi:hypothetical protein
VASPKEIYAAFVSSRGLEPVEAFQPGPVTPLLTNGGRLNPAARGELHPGVTGTIARYSYGFTYNVVYAEIPESQPFIPRLGCDRKGRITSNVHYGFEMRTSRLWTESEVLNERYRVTVSPFQDDNWLRQLYVPTFIDYLAQTPPADFSFELAYGALLCSVEEDDLDEAGLATLWEVAGAVAKRIKEESNE